ncbi:hypothetical protein Tco_0183407 [Tanacetum coccineum]
MSKASDDIQERELHQLQQMQHKAKESCMKSFRLLQSHLQVLSYNDLKINGCFERAFATLFEQDVQTFTGIMLLNLDQLEKQLDKDEFQGDRSMAAFCVINKQFQMFIDSQFTWDYDSQMTEKYFAEYTGIEVKQFRETLLLHMDAIKKRKVCFRVKHWMQVYCYIRRWTKSDEHITSSSSGTYITHVLDADIKRLVNDQVPFSEDAPEFCEFFEINDLKAQLQAKTTLICNLKNQIKSVKEASNEAKVKNDIDTYKELYDSIKKTRVQNKDISDSLISQINQKSVENADLKAQIQEKVFANAALKNELRKLKGNSVDTKFAKPSILGKPVLQPPRNQSVVRQPNAFKSERPNVSKPRFASQVDVNNSEKPTGSNFKTEVLVIPTGKMFTDSITNVDSEPLNGLNDDIANPYECDQTLYFSAVHEVSNAKEYKAKNTKLKVVAEKQAGYVQTNLTLSSAELEIQSMVDVPIHQEDLTVQRTLLIDPVILMEIPLKMNLPDHRSVLTDPEDQAKMEMEIPRSSGVNSPPNAHT